MTKFHPDGSIIVEPGSLRLDLEVTRISAGGASHCLQRQLSLARAELFGAGKLLPYASDASEKTLTALAEADEILQNLIVRIVNEVPLRRSFEGGSKS